MQIYDQPPLPPHICAICRSGPGPQRQWFLDLQVFYELPGIPGESGIYLCERCIDEVIRLCPSAYSHKEINDVVVSQERAVAEAKEIINKYDKRKEALEEMGINLDKFLEAFNGRTIDGTDEIDEGNESNDSESELDNPETIRDDSRTNAFLDAFASIPLRS